MDGNQGISNIQKIIDINLKLLSPNMIITRQYHLINVNSINYVM